MSVSLETKLATPPLPVPAHFSQAEQSFSLKKRRLPFSSSSSSTSSLSPPALLSHSLPPRPPSKGCPPLSRVFPQRLPSPWTALSSSLLQAPPPAALYDPSRQRSFFSQCFTNLGLLGRGSFGEVYKVLSLQDGRHYAVKRSVQRFRGAGERKRSVREAWNHERLGRHPHILGFVAAWEEGARLYIQTELCCTSLLLHAEAQPPSPGPDEASAWTYLCDLLSALQHLHTRGYAHLDLKPANVFLTASGRLKLGDFGLLLQLSGGEGGGGGGGGGGRAGEEGGGGGGPGREKEDIQEGDPRYMAPELLRGEYGTAADVFSLGVSILELACNMELPQGGEGWQQLRRGFLPSQFTNGLSVELQCVLRMMLCPEPSSRASVCQLLALPSVCQRRRARWLRLLLHETLLSLLSVWQSVVSWGRGLLLSLPLPSRTPPAPATPPRESWDLTLPPSPLHTLHTLSDSPEDDAVFLPDALDLSPTFSHRVKSRLSVGSTSTPLPNSPTHTQHFLTHTPTHSGHCLTHTPTHSGHCLTHTPSSIYANGSHHTLPPHTPIDTHTHSQLSAHTHTPSSQRPVRSEPVPRPGFEPKNLLSLFDETL